MSLFVRVLGRLDVLDGDACVFGADLAERLGQPDVTKGRVVTVVLAGPDALVVRDAIGVRGRQRGPDGLGEGAIGMVDAARFSSEVDEAVGGAEVVDAARCAFVPSKASIKPQGRATVSHFERAGTVILKWKKELGDEGRNKNEKV